LTLLTLLLWIFLWIRVMPPWTILRRVEKGSGFMGSYGYDSPHPVLLDLGVDGDHDVDLVTRPAPAALAAVFGPRVGMAQLAARAAGEPWPDPVEGAEGHR
jgi:hypothetical protein